MDDNYSIIDQRLLQAYLHTTYQVDFPDIKIKIGEPNPDLNALLVSSQTESWAFITAWNPKSSLLSTKENDWRHQKLVRIVKNTGYPHFEGKGIGKDSDWPPEISLLILGISKMEALELGREFRQNAIVFGEKSQVPALIFC